MPKKITLKTLREADPDAFAKLCERAGDPKPMYELMKKSNAPDDLYRCAEIAYTDGKYQEALGLIQKARVASKEKLEISEGIAYSASMSMDGSGSMGAAMSYGNAQDRHKAITNKTAALEAKINEQLKLHIQEEKPKEIKFYREAGDIFKVVVLKKVRRDYGKAEGTEYTLKLLEVVSTNAKNPPKPGLEFKVWASMFSHGYTGWSLRDK